MNNVNAIPAEQDGITFQRNLRAPVDSLLLKPQSRTTGLRKLDERSNTAGEI
jgi:hypothetical protein